MSDHATVRQQAGREALGVGTWTFLLTSRA